MNFVEPASSVINGAVQVVPPLRRRRTWPISYGSVSGLAIACDALTILTIGVVSDILYNWYVWYDWYAAFIVPGGTIRYLGSGAVVSVLFVCVMRAQDLYNPTELLSLRTQVFATIGTWFSVFLFLSGAAFALKTGSEFSRGAIFIFALTGLSALLVERIFYRSLLRRGLAAHRFAGRQAVLVTDDPSGSGESLVRTLLKHSFRLEQSFVLPAERRNSSQIEEFVTRICEYVRGSDIDEVILGIGADRWDELGKLLSGLRVLPLPISLIPVGAAADILKRPTHILGDSICVELHRGPLGAFERSVKRGIDLFGAIAGLILLSPLLIATAILVKLDSRGPIFFKQKRCGFNGRVFEIFKFRTMSVLEDGPSICQATKNDCRVTRLGRWLRRTSIDELPQLLNVFAGTMSLVGPRPHALAHDNHFDKVVRKYAFRHHVKPGLTGWAQVHGHRGPTPSLDHIQRRVQFDLWYIDNWSLRLDLLIIAKTFFELVRGRNAY